MSQISGLLSLSKYINNNDKIEINDNKKYLEDVISKIKQTTTLSNQSKSLKVKAN